MVRVCLFCLFLLANGLLPVFSQISWTNNSIRAGDKIIKQQYPYVDPGSSGYGQLWDFSQLPPSSRDYTLEYTTPGLLNDSIYIMGCDTFLKEDIRPEELLVGMEHYTVYYYRQQDSALFLLGYENPLTLVHYEEPLCLMRYPSDTSRIVNQNYWAQTIYSSEKGYGTKGLVSTFSDADGSLILPSGDTISQVTRIKTIQTSLSSEQDTISLMPLTVETYKWYAEGYRYPLFETLRIIKGGDGHEIFRTAYFYPPEAHTYLEDDPANLLIQEQRMASEEQPVVRSRDLAHKWMLSGKLWACSFYPNPVADKLFIDFRVDEDMPVAALVYDLSGRLLMKMPEYRKSGQYSEYLDFTGIQAGSYILKFVCGEDQKSEIIIKK